MAHQTGSPALPNGLFHRLERAVLKLNPAHSATLCEPRTCLGSLDWRNILTPAARSAAACRQATNGVSLHNASCTREIESKLSFLSFALPLHNASCTREIESKLSFLSFALPLQKVKQHNDKETYKE